MSDLVFIAFDSEQKAEEVREKTLAMQKEYLIELGDAVVAVKDANGRIKLNQLMNTTAAGAVSGALWGTLIGLIFLNPLLGMGIGAASGAIIATNGRVEIGDYAFVAHEVVLGDRAAATPSPSDRDSASILLGANCWIGARAVLLGGAKIGEGAIVGAAAVVEGEVPPYAIAVGNPARIIRSARLRPG